MHMLGCRPQKPFNDNITVEITMKGHKYDIDNVVKPILDALQRAMIITDDKYITDLIVHKRWDTEKFLWIEVQNGDTNS